MDLNLKIAFRCDASTIEDVDEDDPNVEIVDADNFWGKVEQNIVSHAYPSRKVAAFYVHNIALKNGHHLWLDILQINLTYSIP